MDEHAIHNTNVASQAHEHKVVSRFYMFLLIIETYKWRHASIVATW